MRTLIMCLTFGLVFATCSPVAAANSDSAAKQTVVKKKSKLAKAKAVKGQKSRLSAAKTKTKKASELSTDVKFDDSVLHGQYQTPDEALVKVENEKGLNDLLGVRKHFKDRLTTASEQE